MSAVVSRAHAIPWPGVLIAQGAGLVVAAGIGFVAQAAGLPWAWSALTASQSIVAAATSYMLGLPWWWGWLNLAFVPLMAVALVLDVSPAIPASLFLALVAVFGTGTVIGRIPVFLSNRRALEALRRALPRHAFSMIDLGAGDGRVLRFVAAVRRDARLFGVESAPLPYFVARMRGLSAPYRVAFGDLWRCDLADYDVVYAYLSPAAMPRLWQKAKHEMRPGSVLMSNGFAVPGVEPADVLGYGRGEGERLYLWRMS